MENLRKIINGIDAIDELNESNAYRFENKVIPDLAKEVLKGTSGDDLVKIEKVVGLLENKALGVVSFDSAQPLDKVKGLSVEQQRFAVTGKEAYAVMILVNPAVSDSLVPENQETISQMREVMLEAYDKWKDLADKRQFLPAYEIK